MKSIFAFCLVLGLVFSAHSAMSLTKTKVFAQNISGSDVPSVGGSGQDWPVANVQIKCIPNQVCHLDCYGIGYLACSWNNGFNGGCDGCDEDFFNAGNAQEMFDHATDQIIASVTSGTYVSNILPPTGPHYFRSITWSYNSMANEYNMTLTLTEVTP